MNCNLSDKVLRAYRSRVIKDLNNFVEENKSLDLKSYLAEKYAKGLEISKGDEVAALDFAMVTPRFILQAVAQDENLTALDIDLNELRKLMNDFAKEDGHEQAKKYLAIESTFKEEVKTKVDIQDPEDEYEVPTGLGEHKDVSGEAIHEVEYNGKFRAYAPSFLIDSEWEVLSIEEGDPNYNVIDPVKAFYFNIKREILRELGANENSSEMNFRGQGPVFLRAVEVSTLDAADKKPISTDKLSQEELDKGIALVVVDKAGNPIRFDKSTGEISEDGRLVYFNMRNSAQFIRDGKVELNSEEKKRAAVIAKNMTLSQSEAEEYLKNQIQFVDSIRTYIKENPEDHSVTLVVTGGSFGYPSWDFNTKTKLSEVNFGDAKFQPTPAKKGHVFYSGQFYFNLNNDSNTPIKIDAPYLKDTTYADILVTLLTEPIYDRLGNQLTPKQLEDYAGVYTYLTDERLRVHQNGAVSLRGEYLDLSTPEARQKSARILREYFTELAPVRKIKNPGKRKVVKDKKDYELNSVVKDGEGNYWVIEYVRLNPINKINKRFNDITGFKTNADGNLVIQTSEREFNDYLIENWTTPYKLNNNKEIVAVQAYLAFDLAEDQLGKVSKDVTTKKEFDNDIEPADAYRSMLDDAMTTPKYQSGRYNLSFKLAAIIKDNLVSGEISPEYARAVVEFWKDVKGYQGQPNLSDKQLKGLNAAIDKIAKEDPVKKVDPEIQKESEEAEKIVEETKLDELDVPNVESPDQDLLDLNDDILDDPSLSKRMDQKDVNVEATEKQIKDARKWYENHPLNEHFPFEAMFHLINASSPNSVATWAMHGIRLYQGSDFSDLYHESWHGFSQAFLTPKQRKDLYNSVRKLAGTFRDYNGNTVLFARATDLQIEEYLAEGFRTYMLSDGKSVTKSKKVNSFFNFIMRVLDALFGTLTWSEVMTDPTAANNTIKDLYDKLRVGDLSGFDFNRDNTQFGSLNQGIRSSDSNESVQELSYEASYDLLEITDSLISDYIDLQNTASALSKEDRIEFGNLYNKIALGLLSGDALKEAQARIDVLTKSPKKKHGFTSGLLSTLKGRSAAYSYVKKMMAQMAENLEAKIRVETNDVKKADLLKRAKTLTWAVRNFGDVTNLENNLPDENGNIFNLIPYHASKSKRFMSDIVYDSVFGQEVSTEQEIMLKGREYTALTNEHSSKDMAKREVLHMVYSLHEVNSKGEPVYNEYGSKKLADFGETWNKLAVTLENTLDTTVMYDKLVELSKSYPVIKQMLNKIGSPNKSNPTHLEQQLWSNFTAAFNLARVPLVQMALERTEGGTYNSKVGEAFGVFKGVGRAWESEFQRTQANEYIGTDEQGNFLKIDKVIKKFPSEESISGKEIEFLNAIGINVADKPVIRQILSVGDVKEGYRENLAGLIWRAVDQVNDIVSEHSIQIRSIKDLIKEYKEYGKPGNENGNFNQIQKIELQYGDERSNFMVQNAEGNSQFEHMLNNTMTIEVNTINAVNNYQELISLPHMSHYDIKRNPELKYNRILNSIFILDETSPQYGQKRKATTDANASDVKLKMVNLSGALLYDEEGESQPGTASASADEFTKMILDFHLATNPNGFMAEMMRHADKSTSFAVAVTRSDKSKTGLHYIDFEDFIAGEAHFHGVAYEQFLKGYVLGEHARILQLRQLEKDNEGNENFEFDHKYLKEGQKITIFEDIFDDNITKELLSVETDLEEYFKTEDGIILENKIRAALETYFNNQIESIDAKFSEAEYISDGLYSHMGGVFAAAGMDPRKYARSARRAVLIKSMVYNQWIHNVETLNFFYGNLAMYNTASQDFHKRNAGIGSTGTLFRTDSSMLNYINKSIGRGYAENEGYEYDEYDGTLNTAVIQDVTLPSVYYNDYADSIEKDVEKSITDSWDEAENGKLTKTKLKKAVNLKLYGKGGTRKQPAKGGIMYAYSKMDEGDAQGLISFDTYRILQISQGEWDFKTQEPLYQKIIKGENIDQTQISTMFPPAKYQYWGPLATESAPMIAFHKYSLMPLVPGTFKEGSNADILNRKMLEQKVDYVVFKSGSKMSTISKPSGVDKLYDKTRVIQDITLTSNRIYVNFLKNQLKTNKQFKGKVTFPTQLRKLIEDGLMEYGVPIDYEPTLSKTERIAKWKGLDGDEKLKNDKYKLLKAYETTVAALTKKKKEKLLQEAGLTEDKNGKITGKTDKLWKFVKNELATNEDLADHEIDFIQYKDGKLKHDLSMSLSADKMEKLLNAIVTKRLIKQKFHGEGLFQQSAAFMESLESKHDYTNPTQEDIDKWGSNDLPAYRPGKDGITKAAKAKIALQGDFEHLLYLKDKEGKSITVYDEVIENGIMRKKLNYNASLDALNKLLKDEEWLDMNNHREMITIVGVRIPVQGLNSMEFIEVYEFLPKTANNVIIMPSEIVAKAGSDFDIDKLTLMMPNIKKKYKSPFNNALLRELQAQYKDLDFSRQNVDILLDALKNGEETYTLTNEDRQVLMALDAYVETEISYNVDGSEKGLENKLITDMVNILSLEDNFNTLIRPNGTDILDPIQQELGPIVSDYNPSFSYQGRAIEKGKISPTRVLEYEYNLHKHQTNNIGKATLGLGAVDNTYNTLFNRINAYLNPTTEYGAQTLFMDHNTVEVDGQEAISLAGSRDKKGENRISDVINQLLNGWLDVAKDAWIFNIQGNKELSPAMLFLIQAGVPVNQAIYMLSLPTVRAYVAAQRKYKSTFSEVLGYGTDRAFARSNAAKEILNQIGIPVGQDESHMKVVTQRIAGQMASAGITEFTEDSLKGLVELNMKVNDEITENEKAAFLHFLQIEEMAKSVRDVKLRMNVDTAESKSLFAASDRIRLIDELRNDGRISETLVDKLLTDSPISSFAIQDFQLELWKDAFPLRNHKVVNEFVSRMLTMDLVNNTLGDSERVANAIKNDLLLYIFQNTFNTVNLDTLKSYRGFEVETSSTKIAEIKEVKTLEYGVFMKDGVLYIDKNQIIKDFNEKKFASQAYAEMGLAKVHADAFETVDDYAKFLLEREYLRQSTSLSEMMLTPEFQLRADMIAQRGYWERFDHESKEAYEKRFNRNVYETILKDKALDNSFNSWKLFQSPDTFAHQFDAIKTDHPELVKKFPLLKYFVISKSPDGYTNIKLVDTNLDSGMINQIHEMFVKLTKPNELGFTDPVEARRVSDFFRKLPIVGFLQSGLTTKGQFAMGRYLPQELLLSLMEQPVKEYTKHFDTFVNASGRVIGIPLILEDFAQKFEDKNNRRNFSTMFRHKNYHSDVKLSHSIKAGVMTREDRLRKLYDIPGARVTPITLTKAEDMKIDASLYDPRDVLSAIEGMEPSEQPTTQPQADVIAPKNVFTVEPKQAVDKKAKAKAKIATQYIGFAEGISGSSTALYAEQAGQYANTGNYSSNDVIFVSIPGKRGSAELQKQNQDRTIKEAIKAVEAGATIITDNQAYMNSSKYNTGERALYVAMGNAGYNYSEVTVDGQTLGTWSKSTQPQAVEPKPENIASAKYGGSEFAQKLTNPGNNLTVQYKGNTFRNSEHAYQTWKSGEFDEVAYKSKAFKPTGSKPVDPKTSYQTMVDILIAKFEQHPELILGIEKRGGLAYIEQSTHNVVGDKFWESSGQNKFIEALAQAYKKASVPYRVAAGTSPIRGRIRTQIMLDKVEFIEGNTTVKQAIEAAVKQNRNKKLTGVLKTYLELLDPTILNRNVFGSRDTINDDGFGTLGVSAATEFLLLSRVSETQKATSLTVRQTQTMTHELSHMLTLQPFIKLHDGVPLTERETEFVNEMEELFKYVQELPKFADSRFYGMTNVYEFIAEAMADENFRDYLNSISYSKGKTVLTRLMEIIMKLFGVRPGTALETVINQVYSLREDVNFKHYSTLHHLTNEFAPLDSEIGIKKYPKAGTTQQKAEARDEFTPNTVVVYDGALDPKGSLAQISKPDSNPNAAIHHSDIRKQALITRKTFTQGGGMASDMEFQDDKPSGALATTIDPEAKEVIDAGIEALKQLVESGKKLAFNKYGYGQYMIGADMFAEGASSEEEIAGKTFDYLSEQLYSNFGYINPNWLDRSQGKAKVQELSDQMVTDEMVRDFMFKIC